MAKDFLKKKQSSMHKNERFVLLMEKTEEISHDESTPSAEIDCSFGCLGHRP